MAAEGLGWEPVCFAEIDPFPSAVLAYHYPNVPNVGDVSKVDWSPYRGKCDLIVGGSPCQSFSIAGKREGLNGASGLMWEYVRAIRELRPEWIVWENVQGALSSSGGGDFRCLLSALDELGYGLAWRILDAQFFGVPQRRRRVFLVGHFGDRPPTEVLFERESLRGDFETSRKKREALTARACRCAYESKSDCLNAGDPQSKRVYRTYGVAPEPSSGTTEGMQLAPAILCVADDNAHAAIDQDVCGTLKVGGAAPMVAYDDTGGEMVVRKLTPKECERLQGFPDDYTKVPYKGKPAEDCPDTPRYKALGNSMSVPVMRWIFERLDTASKGSTIDD